MTFILGDCVEAMPEMAENSVDACVTDPPYGLEFMGKDWDKLEPARKSQRWAGMERKLIGNGAGKGKGFAARMGEMPNFRPKRNARCRKCHHYRFSGTPCQCKEPDWDNRMNEHAYYQQAWHFRWAQELYRVLKPGAHLLAFGGTRTHHRLWCAVEDAGFEIRDTVMWLQGQGFPKSLDVSKAIDKAAGAEREVLGRYTMPADSDAGNAGKVIRGKRTSSFSEAFPAGVAITAPATEAAQQWQGWGTALKPGWEPILVARKPLSEKNVAANVLRWGTGALNVDGCRLATTENRDRPPRTPNAIYGGGRGTNLTDSTGSPQGRWPANVALDEEAARMVDEQSGDRPSGTKRPGYRRHTAKGWSGPFEDDNGGPAFRSLTGGDHGGASRFFYCAKASRKEREAGLDGRNMHPTVKPVALMRWLVRLVTPPGGTVLDPFMGSGTTGIACVEEGFDFVGIEKEADYVEIARKRIAHAEGKMPLFAEVGT